MEAIFGWFCIGGLILLLCVAVILVLSPAEENDCGFYCDRYWSGRGWKRALLICFDLLLLAGGFFALCEYLRRL